MKIKILIAATTLLLFNGSVLAELDPLENYDNFNAKKVDGCKFCIDSKKWIGRERGEFNTEVERKIKAKRANLYHRSWGRRDSNIGTVQGRNRMNFRHSEMFSGACFTPKVAKYDLQKCAANESWGQVRIRYLGNFYDTSNADDGDEDGLIYAGISLRRGNWTNAKKGIFEIDAWAQECEGADCDDDAWSTYDEVDDPDLFFGTTKGSKNKKELCIGYDRDNHELVFSYGNDVRKVNAVDHGLPAFGDNVDAEWTWHVIETRTDVENCTAKKLSGSIDANFDNVTIRQFSEEP